ncbi:MAG TPA: hydroxyisourate hydrolase [Stellaceae bacterium]
MTAAGTSASSAGSAADTGATGGKLTTHVLDTANGRPAAGLRIDLYRLDGEVRRRLASVRTNADGRCDAPLLAGDALALGTYLLIFHVGDYFAAGAGTGAVEDGKRQEPAFLDKVPIKFGVSDPSAHYHVPLLVAPYGYSTYRGS